MNYDHNGGGFPNPPADSFNRGNGFLTSLCEDERQANWNSSWNCHNSQQQFIQDESLYNLLHEDHQAVYNGWDPSLQPDYSNYQQYPEQYNQYAEYYNYDPNYNHNYNDFSQVVEYTSADYQCQDQMNQNQMNFGYDGRGVYSMMDTVYNHQQLDNQQNQLRKDKMKQEYPCDVCGKKFKHPYLLERHQRKRDHRNIKEFKCKLCKQSFSLKGHLNRHYNLVHQKLPCDSQMPFRHHGMPQLTTVLQRSQKKNNLKIPDLIKGLIELFECPNCNEVFQKYVDFRNHLTTAHKEKRKYACPHAGCDQLFEKLEDALAHCKVEHPGADPPRTTGQLRCPICRQDFSRTDALKRHQRKHEEKRLECPFKDFTKCMRTFYRLDDLKQHLEDHKDPKFKSATLACDVCGRLFKSAKELEKHKTTHPSKFKAHCSKCHKGFKNAHGLRVHSCPVTNERRKKNSVRMKRLHKQRRQDVIENSQL